MGTDRLLAWILTGFLVMPGCHTCIMEQVMAAYEQEDCGGLVMTMLDLRDSLIKHTQTVLGTVSIEHLLYMDDEEFAKTVCEMTGDDDDEVRTIGSLSTLLRIPKEDLTEHYLSYIRRIEQLGPGGLQELTQKLDFQEYAFPVMKGIGFPVFPLQASAEEIERELNYMVNVYGNNFLQMLSIFPVSFDLPLVTDTASLARSLASATSLEDFADMMGYNPKRVEGLVNVFLADDYIEVLDQTRMIADVSIQAKMHGLLDLL